MSSKRITSFTAQLVTFDTPLPYSEVVKRFEQEVNKPLAQSKDFLLKLKNAASKTEIEDLVNSVRGDHDFVYFLEMQHHRWLSVFDGKAHPATTVYTIGNPLIAQTLAKYDLHVVFHVPPRVLVVEKADGSGTNVIYHLPSSVMAAEHNPGFLAAAQALDTKIDRLIAKVTSVHEAIGE